MNSKSASEILCHGAVETAKLAGAQDEEKVSENL